MKLVLLIGDTAVGKMTVGQELAKRTGLKLFHNHMTIEPVIEVFGEYRQDVVARLREVVFEEFAGTSQYGLIFTYMWAFDQLEDWAYMAHVCDIFRTRRPETEIMYVELIAPQTVRLQRNAGENRLLHKASKRDRETSDRRLLESDIRYRCVSYEGELPFENYLRLDNTDLSPQAAAARIADAFSL